MAKKKTTEQFAQDLCNKFNITLNDFTISEYQGYDKKITFTCNRCNLTKTVTASSLLKTNEHKIHICRCYGYSKEYLQTKKEFDIWARNQDKYFILEEFKGITKNILIKCKECGAKQNRSISSLLKDDACLVCEKKVSIPKTKEQFIKEIDELYEGEYEVIGKYKNSNTNILVKHTICGKVFKAKPHNLLTQKGGKCPVCKVKSRGELLIKEFLVTNKINFIEEYRMKVWKRAPYDFYLPDYNLLIDFQGRQHYEPISVFGGKPSFERQKEIDQKKREIAKENNIDLLEIPYTAINDISSTLVQRLSLGRE